MKQNKNRISNWFILSLILWGFAGATAGEDATPPPAPLMAPAEGFTTQATPEMSKAEKDWTYKKYLKTFKKSGRTSRLTSKEFDKLQERKEIMVKDIRRYL
jgi:hypothetical protein